MPKKVVAAYLNEAIHNLEEALVHMVRLNGTRDYDGDVVRKISDALEITIAACEGLEEA